MGCPLNQPAPAACPPLSPADQRLMQSFLFVSRPPYRQRWRQHAHAERGRITKKKKHNPEKSGHGRRPARKRMHTLPSAEQVLSQVGDYGRKCHGDSAD